jgi:Flp pilus assembly protein TadD
MFEKSVGKQPRNATYQYHLGLAYAKTGQNDKARGALEKALQLDPKFADADAARKALTELKG